ncbi:MAG: acyl transferase [Chitinophagales bacterium]|nr:acyl transferase [Chitinophagales bacterium]
MQLEAQHILNLKPGDSLPLIFKIFNYQWENNPIYREYIELLSVKPQSVNNVADIPFLPVEVFKTHKISCTDKYDAIFESSATTGVERSKHYIANLSFYQNISQGIFEKYYGSLSDITILALLPSYFDSPSSSLLYMVEHFIKQNTAGEGGFHMDDNDALIEKLKMFNDEGKKHILLGVSYALLDFAEKMPAKIPSTIVMETGGMKGRRKEITRAELHEKLSEAFGVGQIHSEYGMTELQSQFYSKGAGVFHIPPTAQVVIKDPYDPMRILENGETGKIAVIDIANYQSCSFIQTSDLGRINSYGDLEVLGRIDNSDIRGCNLMIA